MVATVEYGIPVAGEQDPGGSLVTGPGMLQYGRVLFGDGTAAGWRDLHNWRNLSDAETADTPRPQAHGSYAGSVFGGSLAVTFTYLVRGTPDDKVRALDTIERHTPMDGVERMLVVDDGTGPWYRWARVIGREVPQDRNFRNGPVECSVMFLCADPRRYALAERSGTVSLPAASGGLTYPLDYPLSYGDPVVSSFTATNEGGATTPLVAEFNGPLERPVLSCDDWRLGFDITLVAGETLTVDTQAGTALLNDTADRLYTIQPSSDPIERCLLPAGGTTLSLTAVSGTGTVTVRYHDARL